MGSLIDSIRLKFACFLAGFSTYLCALFGFMDKWLFRLKGVSVSPETESNSSMKSKSLEVEELKIDPLIGLDGIGSWKEDSKPESFLNFRFRSYDEFTDGARRDDESSSDDDFYDPCFDAQIIEDFDCDEDDPLCASKAASFRGGSNEDPKDGKGDDHCKNSDGPYVCSKAEKCEDHCKNSSGPYVCSKAESLRGDGDKDPNAEKSDEHCENSDGPYVCLKAESLRGDGGEELKVERGDDHCKNLDGPYVCLQAESLRGDGGEYLKAEKGDDHCKNSDGPYVCLKAESLQGGGGEGLEAEKADDHSSDDCRVPEDPKAIRGSDHSENSDDCRVPEGPNVVKGDDHCKKSVDRLVPEDIKPFADEDDDFEVSSGSDSESVVSSSNFSIRSSLLDSVNDAYVSDDDDFEGKIDLTMLKGIEIGEGGSDKKSSLEEAEFEELSKGYENDDSEEDEELLVELKGIEEDVAKEKREGEEGKGQEENPPKEEALDWEEEEESNGMETQWEHQDLIEQLRMEIGKVRAVGLPTIFEDSEPPKMSDDLKPWKIDEKLFRTGGTMDEVHNFYKSYRERMRKFDIFNFQKMYTIGFLRLKDPIQSFSPQKISLATIVSQDCWPKSSATGSYPMLKFTRELESDLETVYVGQVCLSWEFLRWEYGKALALWDSDPHEVRRFNEVAREFQQFQVLLQRFLEDEPFRGSGRVQNFVKNRCVNRRLLQVPVIREDSPKDKMKQRQAGSTGNDAVTSVILIEMIEESIRLVWQLVRTDMDTTTSTILSIRKASHPDLQNPDDATLLIDVQETLRKKQKKLKELMRSECCILKKLQRNHTKQNYAGRVLCFFSQVDMKLVSRVLKMTRVTTDQLAWCSSKLENIEFVENRIRREPSFLLFPCS